MASKFETDLTRGRTAEDLLFNILKNKNPVHAPDRYFPDWDISSDAGTFEVKYDELAHLTGNIYLEEKALHKTKADYWAIAYGKPIQAFYILKTDTLREFYPKWASTIRGGDFHEPAKIIKRQLFLELLKPHTIEIKWATHALEK